MSRSRLSRRYEIFTHNGTRKTGMHPVEFAEHLKPWCRRNLLNSIDHDGEMKGYDLDLVDRVREAVTSRFPYSVAQALWGILRA